VLLYCTRKPVFLVFFTFRDFIEAMDPLYLPHLPTREILVEKLVPELYEELRVGIQAGLAQAATTALAAEVWTSYGSVLVAVVVVVVEAVAAAAVAVLVGSCCFSCCCSHHCC